ncbi:MAG TPA: hypothetical protein VK661_05085 [Planctomycetota bacterium]|nr:hypothetical protein [Planctomycetota bacterium]
MFRSVSLGLCLLLAHQDPADKVRALVEKLGSDEIALREEATRDLARIGIAAVPELRKAAAESTGEKKVLIDRLINRLTAFGKPAWVSIEAKDRPLREIAADLERQTGIPIRLVGSASEGKATLSVKDAILWRVVEDVCRARGDLMYRFQDDGIEIYPSKFRSLPSVDKDGMRFFIDRFIWDGGGDQFPGHLREHAALLVPRGTRVVWIGWKIEEVTDDKGNNLAKEPDRGGGDFGGPPRIVEPRGFKALPTSRTFFYPFYFHRLNQPPPAPEATKLTRIRGTIHVAVAEGLQLLASIPNPLSRPSTPSREGIPSLGIPLWKEEDGHLLLRVNAVWNADCERDLWRDIKPLLILNEKSGDWQVSPRWYTQSRLSPKDVDRIDNIVSFPWRKGSSAVSLDLVAPHPLVMVEIPFDFRDIPLR